MAWRSLGGGLQASNRLLYTRGFMPVPTPRNCMGMIMPVPTPRHELDHACTHPQACWTKPTHNIPKMRRQQMRSDKLFKPKLLQFYTLSHLSYCNFDDITGKNGEFVFTSITFPIKILCVGCELYSTNVLYCTYTRLYQVVEHNHFMH